MAPHDSVYLWWQVMIWLRRSHSWYRVDVKCHLREILWSEGEDWKKMGGGGGKKLQRRTIYFEVTCPWGTVYFGGQVTSWQTAIFFLLGAQFSRKLAMLYEYSYLDPVLIWIFILSMTKEFVTLKQGEKKKKKAMKYPFPVSSPNPNYNTTS